MEFDVEHNVPMPEHHGRKLYDFPALGIGESFFIPDACTRWSRTEPNNPVVWAARTYYRRRGIPLTLRAENNGVRVWRRG